MTWRTALSFIPWTEPERKERSGYDRPIFCCRYVYDDQSGAGSGNDVRRPVSAAPPAGADTLPGAAGGPLGGGLDQPVQSELLRPAQPGPHPARHLP